MTRFKDFFKVMLLMVIACTTFTACGDDDDDEFTQEDLSSYVIGKWRSYKGIVTANGQTETVSITKTNEYSPAYYEIEFKNDGTAIFSAWVEDDNGLSSWMQENVKYQVVNNDIWLKDSTGEIASLSYDSKEKALYLRVVLDDDYGTQTTVYIYMKK